jgi:hypothetical protein
MCSISRLLEPAAPDSAMHNRHGGAFGYHRSRDGPLLIHRLRSLHRDLPGTPWKCECEFVAGVVDDDNLAPRIPSVRRLDVVYHNIAPWNGSRDITVHRLPTGHAEAGMRASQCDSFLEVVINIFVLGPQVPMDCIDGVRYIEAVGGLCPIRQTILIAQEFVPFTDEWYPLRRQDNASAEFLARP